MIKAATLVRSLALLLMMVAAGCAPAYHAYSGCYVDCKYCEPPPLPYVHYDNCACHSCAASVHLSIQSKAVDGDAVEPQVSME